MPEKVEVSQPLLDRTLGDAVGGTDPLVVDAIRHRDRGESLLSELEAHLSREIRRPQEGAGHALADQHLPERLVGQLGPIDVDEEQVVVRLREFLAHPVEEGAVEAGVERGTASIDQGDGARRPPHRLARGSAKPIGGLEDLPAGGLADVRLPVQDARDGPDRDVRRLCNVPDAGDG